MKCDKCQAEIQGKPFTVAWNGSSGQIIFQFCTDCMNVIRKYDPVKFEDEMVWSEITSRGRRYVNKPMTIDEFKQSPPGTTWEGYGITIRKNY